MNLLPIQFLVRSGCHLCDAAAPAVRRAARAAGREIVVVDIDTDDRLVRDFGLRIPVVVLGGVPIAEGAIRPLRLWWRIVTMRSAR